MVTIKIKAPLVAIGAQKCMEKAIIYCFFICDSYQVTDEVKPRVIVILALVSISMLHRYVIAIIEEGVIK